jgi:hypothetical protein
MAAVVSIPTSRQNSLGAWKLGIADVTMDASYPTGGELLAIADWGLVTVAYIVLIDGAQGFHGVWDYTALKLVVYTMGITTGGTGAAADSGSGALITDTAGAETVIHANDSVASTTYDFGPLKEVPSTTDLSTVKFRVMMIGE